MIQLTRGGEIGRIKHCRKRLHGLDRRRRRVQGVERSMRRLHGVERNLRRLHGVESDRRNLRGVWSIGFGMLRSIAPRSVNLLPLEGLALLNRPDMLESRLLRISCVDNPKLLERLNNY